MDHQGWLKSEILKQNDIIAGVNDISFMNKTFHKCIQALRIAEWPLTLHIRNQKYIL